MLGQTIAFGIIVSLAALTLAVVFAVLAFSRRCHQNRTGTSSYDDDDEDEYDEEENEEDNATFQKWWIRRRLPVTDFPRWICMIVLLLPYAYDGLFPVMYAMIAWAIHDIIIIIILIVMAASETQKNAIKWYLLIYTLLFGFPVGTYTKIAMSDDIDKVHSLPGIPSKVARVLPYYTWILILIFVCTLAYMGKCCCKCTRKHCGRSWLLFFGNITVLLMWVIFGYTSATYYIIGTYDGTSTDNSSFHPSDYQFYRSVIRHTEDGLPFIGSLRLLCDSSVFYQYWPAWILIVALLCPFTSYMTVLLYDKKKEKFILLLPDYINFWGYSTSLLLTAYLVEFEDRTMSFGNIIGSAYPAAITEFLCLIYDIVMLVQISDCKKPSCQMDCDSRSCDTPECPTVVCPPISCDCSCACRYKLAVFCRRTMEKIRRRNTRKVGDDDTEKGMPENMFLDWTEYDLQRWLKICGPPLNQLQEIVVTKKLTGRKLSELTTSDLENTLGITNKLILQKLQIETLLLYMKDGYLIEQHGCRDETWCQNWCLLSKKNQDSLVSLSDQWLDRWLEDISASDVAPVIKQMGVNGPLLFLLNRNIEIHEYLHISELLMKNIIMGMYVLQMLDYNHDVYTQLKEIQSKHSLCCLYPIWSPSEFSAYIQSKALRVSETNDFGAVLLYQGNYKTQQVMTNLCLDYNMQPLRMQFLSAIKDLLKTAEREVSFIIKPALRRGLTPIPGKQESTLNEQALEEILAIPDIKNFFINLQEQISKMLNMVTMEHSEAAQQEELKVRREKTQMDLSEKAKGAANIPEHWIVDDLSMSLLELPVDTNPVTDEIRDAIESFIKEAWDSSAPKKMKINKITQIQNGKLWNAYAAKKGELFNMAKGYDEGKLPTLADLYQDVNAVATSKINSEPLTSMVDHSINEHYLFHGTKKEIVDAIMKAHGFDNRMANAGFFGKGIYAAEDPKMSDNYVGGSGPFYMFIIRLLLGRSCYLPDTQQSNLVRPPCQDCHRDKGLVNDKCKEHSDYFDSVVGNFTGRKYREFIVYERNQSYPEFLIEYERIN